MTDKRHINLPQITLNNTSGSIKGFQVNDEMLKTSDGITATTKRTPFPARSEFRNSFMTAVTPKVVQSEVQSRLLLEESDKEFI